MNGFQAFLKENIEIPRQKYFIPLFADNYIKSGMGTIKVIPTSAKWFVLLTRKNKPHVKKYSKTHRRWSVCNKAVVSVMRFKKEIALSVLLFTTGCILSSHIVHRLSPITVHHSSFHTHLTSAIKILSSSLNSPSL